MSKRELQNLEFEVRYQMRTLVRKDGGAVLESTGEGRRLLWNLKAIQALKTKIAA